MSRHASSTAATAALEEAKASRASIEHVFDQFVTAVTCKSILSTFNQLLDCTGLRHADHEHFYNTLKGKLAGSWKAQALWTKIDKRSSHRDYKWGQACKNMKVLVIGSGPCGLRTAIECAFLGAKTVVVEKRDRFSRNNVLHLWPYLITDLRSLGAKKFFGKFCAGSIDHISIRQLQCILLKVALLVGVEVHVNVAFEGLVEPTHENGLGWRCNVTPKSHVVSEYVFDVLFGADGKRNTLPGFRRKEFRGKLAIAITANFINRNSQAEASVEEISGVAFIFNQKFFLDLKEKTRIDLENIVYYKDDTHYFVMTAKKASLLEKGVLKEDHADTLTLLDRANINQEALLSYARQAANFSTNDQLPSLDYAVNHYGQADVAMFDFTSMFAAEHASRFILKNGHHLLMGLVGDSLLEPFWPTGSGCARGFLSAFDGAWMMRSWASGKMTPLQVLAERESIYTVLSQTTPNYLHKNFNMYHIDPNTRYPNLNLKAVKPNQLRHLYEGGNFTAMEVEEEDLNVGVPNKKLRSNAAGEVDSYSLLRWCQRVLNTGKYRNVHVVDFTNSWRSGLALCALIDSFRPELINANQLMECDVAQNNQLAFNVAEKELGIPPVMSGSDMAKYEVPDKLTMVAYLSQFYQLFRQDALPSAMPLPVRSSKRKSTNKEPDPKSPRSPNRRISFLQKLSARLAKSKKRKEQEANEGSPLSSKKMKDFPEVKTADVELTSYNKLPMDEIANRLQVDRPTTKIKVSKAEEMSGAISVTAMAEVLSAKFKDLEDKPAPDPVRKMKGTPSLIAATPASEFCTFCHKRVYIMERMSAEGQFFHRGCFKCDHCYVGLRLNNYSYERDERNSVKFFCYRHALPELRIRPRKRFLEEESKENVPQTVIHPPQEEDVQEAPKEKSPRKAAAGLSPLTLPKDVTEKPKKTPERIEFEISFDGQEEESEEEQFEHNLRASLSSDTLLDDEDSDSDSSDLDEGSGAEDDVWESAGENLSPPALPLTLEEACEFVDSWHRTHSHADGSLERERRRQGKYHRLGDEEDNQEEEEGDQEEDEDGDGSSTEVGDSEYETDDSSDEEEEEEDSSMKVALQVSKITAKAATKGNRDGSLVTPTSPSSRLSASKASFFSVPPTVVSLDPWSMFGMGNKNKKADKGDLSDSSNKARQESESSKKEELSGRDNTDVSENLDDDWKSETGGKERERKERKASEGGSLDGLNDDFDEREVALDGRAKDEDKGEAGKEIDSDDGEEQGGEGDDEDEDFDEDEMMEKTAVSYAMEQLLKDIDHKNVKKESTGDNKVLNDSSDSGENESFVEGRLSPSANKTRKFRMNRRARQMKSKRQRSGRSLSITSESEAARTDPTTTDNSQPRSSMSRSPSADIESNGEAQPDSVVAALPGKEAEGLELNEQVEVTMDSAGAGDLGPQKEEAAELASKTEADILLDTDIRGITIETQSTTDDTLRQVLESVAAMPDLSETSDLDELVFANIDDRFVTDRRKRKPKIAENLKPKLKDQELDKKEKEGDDIKTKDDDFSFSISTPSDSETSVSSVDEFAGLEMDVTHGEDDEAPDEEMLKDYQTTMSIALGESYSDEEHGGEVVSQKDLGERKGEMVDQFEKAKEKVEFDEEAGEKKFNDLEIIKKSTDKAEVVDKKYEDETEKSQVKIEVGPKNKEEKIEETSDMRKDNEPASSSHSFALAAEELKDGGDVEMERDDTETLLSTTDSSVYATPDVSLDKRYSGFGLLNNVVLDASMGEDRNASLSKPNFTSVSLVDRHGKVTSPGAVSPSSDTPAKTSGDRELTGSEIYLSPMESFSRSPLANVEVTLSSHSNFKPAAQSSPITSHPSRALPTTKLTQSKSAAVSSHMQSSSSSSQPPPSSSVPSSSTRPLPVPSGSSRIPSSSSSSLSSTSTTTPHIPSSTSSKFSRKLPELPKLKIPSATAVKGGNANNATKENVKQVAPAKSAPAQPKRNLTEASSKLNKKVTKPKQVKQETFEPPISCSSPKVTHKSNPGALKITTNGRVLPQPNLSSISSSTAAVHKPKAPVKSSSASSSSLTTTSSSTISTRATKPTTTTTKTVPSRTSTSNPKAAPFRPLKNIVKDDTFTKPISPPVFRPPPKTVVPLDRSKLQLGSSTETGDSETEMDRKKKISAEGVSVRKDIEDIPFADESESEAQFYTPSASDKKQNPLTSVAMGGSPGQLARKRILPHPPSHSSEPAVLTADQIREIRKVDMEKAKYQARERARLKSDEELGISGIIDSPDNVLARNRANKVKKAENRRSASVDTLSTSDVLSDSDDKLSSSVQSPMSSAAEHDTPDRASKAKENKKKPHKAEKVRKAKKDKKDKDKDKETTDQEKKEKRKSLLALILPGKSAEKSSKESKAGESTGTDSTPKGSDNDTSKVKGKNAKGNKTVAGGKTKRGKGKSDVVDDDPDRTPVLEYRKDLAICSIFHSEMSSRPKERLSNLTTRDAHIAPKASIDDFSDSDESHISMSTMRRMDDDLDERVARRLRKIQLKQQRQAQQKRLRMAQEIQRQLEEVEVRQRELESRGTAVEKILRGDGPEDDDVDEASLMNEWFSLVHEKNALLRYESELNVRAKELELEDRHARLESEFRDRSRKAEKQVSPESVPNKDKKTENDIRMEGLLLDELLDVVKQRDSLVAMLEEDRLRERKEDKELQTVMTQKGYVLSPLSYDTRRDRQVTAPLASPVLS